LKHTINKKVDIPLEVGKTYMLTMATQERFTITKDPYNRKDNVITGPKSTIHGIYEKAPHLGECPIDIHQIIPYSYKVPTEVEICEPCYIKLGSGVETETCECCGNKSVK
jgi:hypothetical protein